HFLYRNGEVFNLTPQPVRMSDLELWEYFHHKIDMETVNPHHFVHTQNELVKRGLIDGNQVPLGEFTDTYFQHNWGV
ncbi:MAG: hypothetical protein PHV62_10090, partial [Sulfuricurvum sp.]|nr:hypothetical protein [Sulfuricurvum sp.]